MLPVRRASARAALPTRWIVHYPKNFSNHRRLPLQSLPSPRPQLPFLHSSHQRSSHRLIARLLSTEQKTHFRWIARTWAKWTAIFWICMGLLGTAKFGLDNETWERQFPTPPDWSFVSRWKLRAAQGKQGDEDIFKVDWAEIGTYYQDLLKRLEDVNGDGHGVVPSLGEGEEILVEGVGKTGFNISEKSEPWRRGYHQALMGAARVAEQLDASVRDKSRDLVFPRNVILGPSNPRPKPVPYGMPAAPKEEDCERAFVPPHVYYLKILTTQGFSSRQRLDAALAYAGWLTYKDLTSSAEDVYKWVLDIVTENQSPETPLPIDKVTGVINPKVSHISSNVILAATSLAAHHAQVGNLDKSLPVYLSILRAQQNLPAPVPKESAVQQQSNGLFQTLSKLVTPEPYPDSPGSGDEHATASSNMTCAISGTMLHIGEILFASDVDTPVDSTKPSRSQLDGLSWTREAVDLAESTLRQLLPAGVGQARLSKSHLSLTGHSSDPEAAAKQRCTECLSAGMDNWLKMIRRFQQAELKAMHQSKNQIESKDTQSLSSANQNDTGLGKWFWGSIAEVKTNHEREPGSRSSPPTLASEDNDEAGVWTQEGKKVQQRAISTRKYIREQGLGS